VNIPLPPPSRNQVIWGDNLKVTSGWPDNCIDGICTDPPYGLGFMGKDWDTFKQENVDLPKTTKLVYKTDYINGIPVKRKKPEIVTRDSGARRAGSYDLSRNFEFQEWFTQWAKVMLRITKPGGFLLCFGGTRTFHRLTCAIEDAGWEIRDCMMWLYGSGFPKSHDISKAIDKKAGVERKITGKRISAYGDSELSETKDGRNLWVKKSTKEVLLKNQPATILAQLWQGYGTALKPAWEPIIVAMKPKAGSFADNVEKYGVAGLNIDGGRIKTKEDCSRSPSSMAGQNCYGKYNYPIGGQGNSQGRWPANLILDEEAGKMLDEQSGDRKGWAGQFHNEFNPYGGNALQKSKTTRKGQHQGYKDSGGASRFFKKIKKPYIYAGKEYEVEGFVKKCKPQAPSNYNDSGSPSRFFYCAKTSRKERDLGMDGAEEKLLARSGGAQGAEKSGKDEYIQKDHIGLNKISKVKNNHPTVKPLALMKYLCTLLKMPGQNQVILDPFLGSGTTAMACKELGINYIGIEKEKEYCEIAKRRIAAIKAEEKCRK